MPTVGVYLTEQEAREFDKLAAKEKKKSSELLAELAQVFIQNGGKL